MKTFVTLFVHNPSVSHLYKDPATIPYCMTKLGYETRYVSFLKKEQIPKDMRDSLSPMNLESIEDDVQGNYSKMGRSMSALKYIWNNAKQIDVLNLYFLKFSILYAIIYKFRNRNGKLYVKLDMDVEDMIRHESDKIERIRRWIYKVYLHLFVDIVSAETSKAIEYMKTRYYVEEPKLQYIPDGLNDYFIQSNHITIKPYEEKENLIITVGRIGTHQKNSEYMLDALEKVENLNGWKFLFVGNVEESFKAEIASFYQRNPQLKECVSFVGAYTDREKLFDMYNRAKVFCLTSRYESFGIVNVEAQWFGNYLLTTHVSSAIDFVESNENLGKIVHSSDELADEIKKIIYGDTDLSVGFNERVEHGKRFAWSRICQRLDDCLKNMMKS